MSDLVHVTCFHDNGARRMMIHHVHRILSLLLTEALKRRKQCTDFI